MFCDIRGKKIIILSHCILNQNAKMDGTANYSGPIIEVLNLLIQSRVGIFQLPCPEMFCLGLDRGNRDGYTFPIIEENSRIRVEMSQNRVMSLLNSITDDLVRQIIDYQTNQFSVIGIVGINRSPTCGIDTTSKENNEIEGQGVFMELFMTKLMNNGIILPSVGIKASEPQKAIESVRKILCLNNMG